MNNLEKLQVTTLNDIELKTICGGETWLKRAWDNTVDALDSAYHWCKDTLSVDIQIGRV